mgnify:CR=1 FL=1
MWAHDLLGLPVDADERAVKRAYAARLKVTRPDDDPAAFQRLVEARDVALQVARAGARKSHQVLALRGYLQYVQGDRKLDPARKVAKLREVVPLIERPEEKRLAISVADEISDPGALELLLTFAQDEAVSREAYSSVVKLAGKPSSGLNKAQRAAALQTVVDKCQQAPILENQGLDDQHSRDRYRACKRP